MARKFDIFYNEHDSYAEHTLIDSDTATTTAESDTVRARKFKVQRHNVGTHVAKGFEAATGNDAVWDETAPAGTYYAPIASFLPSTGTAPAPIPNGDFVEAPVPYYHATLDTPATSTAATTSTQILYDGAALTRDSDVTVPYYSDKVGANSGTSSSVWTYNGGGTDALYHSSTAYDGTNGTDVGGGDQLWGNDALVANDQSNNPSMISLPSWTNNGGSVYAKNTTVTDDTKLLIESSTGVLTRDGDVTSRKPESTTSGVWTQVGSSTTWFLGVPSAEFPSDTGTTQTFYNDGEKLTYAAGTSPGAGEWSFLFVSTSFGGVLYVNRGVSGNPTGHIENLEAGDPTPAAGHWVHASLGTVDRAFAHRANSNSWTNAARTDDSISLTENTYKVLQVGNVKRILLRLAGDVDPDTKKIYRSTVGAASELENPAEGYWQLYNLNSEYHVARLRLASDAVPITMTRREAAFTTVDGDGNNGWEPTSDTVLFYVNGGTRTKLSRHSGNTNNNASEDLPGTGEWATRVVNDVQYLFVNPTGGAIGSFAHTMIRHSEGETQPRPGTRVKIVEPSQSSGVFQITAHCEVTRQEESDSTANLEKLTLRPMLSGADKADDGTVIYSEYDGSGAKVSWHPEAHRYLLFGKTPQAGTTSLTFGAGSTITTADCPTDGASLIIDLTEAPEESYSYFIAANGYLTTDVDNSEAKCWIRQRARFHDPFAGQKFMESRVSASTLNRGRRSTTSESWTNKGPVGINVIAGGLVTLTAGQKYRFDFQFESITEGASVRMHKGRIVALRYDPDTAIIGTTRDGKVCDGTGASETFEVVYENSGMNSEAAVAATVASVPTSGSHLVVSMACLGATESTNSNYRTVGWFGTGGADSSASADYSNNYVLGEVYSGYNVNIDTEWPAGRMQVADSSALDATDRVLIRASVSGANAYATVSNPVLAILPLTGINAASAMFQKNSGGTHTLDAGTAFGAYPAALSGNTVTKTTSLGKSYIQLASAWFRYQNLQAPGVWRPTFDGDSTIGLHAPGHNRQAGNTTSYTATFFLNRKKAASSSSTVSLEGAAFNSQDTEGSISINDPVFSWIEEPEYPAPQPNSRIAILADVENGEIVRDWASPSTNIWRHAVDDFDITDVYVDGDKFSKKLAGGASPAASEWAEHTDSGTKYIYIYLTGDHDAIGANDALAKNPSSTSTVMLVRTLHFDRNSSDIDTGTGTYRHYDSRISRVPSMQAALSMRSGVADSATQLGTLSLANGDGEFDSIAATRVFEGLKVTLRKLHYDLSDNLLDAEIIARGVQGLPAVTPVSFDVRLFDSMLSLIRPVSTTEVTVYKGIYGKDGSANVDLQSPIEITPPAVFGVMRGVAAHRITLDESSATDINNSGAAGDYNQKADPIEYQMSTNGYFTLDEVTAVAGSDEEPQVFTATQTASLRAVEKIPVRTWTGEVGANATPNTASYTNGSATLIDGGKPGWGLGPVNSGDTDLDYQRTNSASVESISGTDSTLATNITSHNIETGIVSVQRAAFWSIASSPAEGTNEMYVVASPPDTVYVDMVSAGVDDASGSATGVANAWLTTPGRMIMYMLKSVSKLADSDIDRYALEKLDLDLRKRLAGHDDTTAVSLEEPYPPSFGVAAQEDETSIQTIRKICEQLLVYSSTNRAGRFTVGIPDLDAGNLVRNGGFDWHEATTDYTDTSFSSIYPWVGLGSDHLHASNPANDPFPLPHTAEVSTDHAFRGASSLKFRVQTWTDWAGGIEQEVELLGGRKYGVTYVIKSTEDTATVSTYPSILLPDGSELTAPTTTYTNTADQKWTRISYNFDVPPVASGTAKIRIRVRYDASGQWFRIDAVELYEILAVLDDTNSVYEGTSRQDEIFYEAAAEYGKDFSSNPRPSSVVVTHTEAEGIANAHPITKYAAPSSGRVTLSNSALDDTASAAGVASAMVNYYGKPRDLIRVAVMGLSTVPLVGDRFDVASLSRLPDRGDAYPFARVVGVAYDPESAHTVSVELERHAEQISDKLKT